VVRGDAPGPPPPSRGRGSRGPRGEPGGRRPPGRGGRQGPEQGCGPRRPEGSPRASAGRVSSPPRRAGEQATGSPRPRDAGPSPGVATVGGEVMARGRHRPRLQDGDSLGGPRRCESMLCGSSLREPEPNEKLSAAVLGAPIRAAAGGPRDGRQVNQRPKSLSRIRGGRIGPRGRAGSATSEPEGHPAAVLEGRGGRDRGSRRSSSLRDRLLAHHPAIVSRCRGVLAGGSGRMRPRMRGQLVASQIESGVIHGPVPEPEPPTAVTGADHPLRDRIQEPVAEKGRTDRAAVGPRDGRQVSHRP